ncbi:hypothetical protein T484DRAFT_2633413 [Baffinella frigidus]|nr:hypothetical protein T484DRAFT_2633413 [Cryptophyta sp. CCMP2293]
MPSGCCVPRTSRRFLEGELLAFDQHSASIVTLSDGKVLYMREVAKDLALVCLMRSENLQRQGLIDYNVQILKQVSIPYHPTVLHPAARH